ncbi:MAG: hypothetical protein KKA05_02595 [Alphaproteobacteria bacterium]|nr:hypothetical protein [Alphaproteobacteria bacterium]
MITFHAIAKDGRPENYPQKLAGEPLEACAAVAVMAQHAAVYKKPWVGYLVTDGAHTVGACGFKSAPSSGVVDVELQVFSGFENRGYGTAILRALTKITKIAGPALMMRAQTLPYEGPASAMLEKCGFTYIGMIEHPEDGLMWEWHLTGV